MELFTTFHEVKIYRSADNKFCAKFKFKNYVNANLDLLLSEIKSDLFDLYKGSLEMIIKEFDLKNNPNDYAMEMIIGIKEKTNYYASPIT